MLSRVGVKMRLSLFVRGMKLTRNRCRRVEKFVEVAAVFFYTGGLAFSSEERSHSVVGLQYDKTSKRMTLKMEEIHLARGSQSNEAGTRRDGS